MLEIEVTTEKSRQMENFLYQMNEGYCSVAWVYIDPTYFIFLYKFSITLSKAYKWTYLYPLQRKGEAIVKELLGLDQEKAA